MSPAHRLFEAVQQQLPHITAIGIGDGGNEIGMGKLPWELIRRNIPHSGLVACRVPTDHLIVCGVSNWGALMDWRPVCGACVGRHGAGVVR